MSMAQTDHRLIDSTDEIIKRSIEYALKHQAPEGYWHGLLESNASMEAEFIFLMYLLGLKYSSLRNKLINRLLETQRADGTWAVYYDAPGELSITVESYFALKLSGVDPNAKHMRLAREFILKKGGVEKTRIFTKIWLALFGQWPWQGLPSLPPEIIFLPNWFFINIYEFACWARATIVPLLVVFANKPLQTLPESQNLKELFLLPFDHPSHFQIVRPKKLFSWKGFFWLMDKGLKLYEKFPWKSVRKKALDNTIQWILEHQEADGTWAGIQPAYAYSLLALKCTGYDCDHPIMQRALEGVRKNYVFEYDDKAICQATISIVWDTALMLSALLYRNSEPIKDNIKKTVNWLLHKQIHTPGDWQVKVKNVQPAGWCFEIENSHYPDIDDTAEIVFALRLYQQTIKDDDTDEVSKAIDKAVTWIMNMQCKNGGWAAFDKDNTRLLLSKLPFCDFGEVLDLPSADVTGHVLEMLGALNFSITHPQIQRALSFLFANQNSNGTWLGIWGVNYLYGTSSVLVGLKSVHYDMSQENIYRGADWIVSKQNSDGSWGESCGSYMSDALHGKGPSTASQTAWAVLGLMAVGEKYHQAIINGIRYLSEKQQTDGIWEEDYFTGTGCTGYLSSIKPEQIKNIDYQGVELSAGFMLRYDYYRLYWPLRALGYFRAIYFPEVNFCKTGKPPFGENI